MLIDTIVILFAFCVITTLLEMAYEYREMVPAERRDNRARYLKITAILIVFLALAGWWLLLRSLSPVLAS